MITTRNQKAIRRTGPWIPIEPSVEPCEVIYVDRIGDDPEKKNRDWRGLRFLLTTPHQRHAVRRQLEGIDDE